ncbi:hypothetical protein ACFV1L_10770 [Kitasatospora sp. NPDC059646]
MLITEDDARTAPFDDRGGLLPAEPPADPLGRPTTRPEEDVPC